jgi:hypothetical protein
MFARLLVASLGLTVLGAVAACESSGRYGTPAYAGAAVGVAAAGAAASRLTGGCFAECLAGTHCNRATGLCESRAEVVPVPRLPGAPVVETEPSRRPALIVRSSSYPPGHEYEVPATSAADAGCAPTSSELGDAGALACEMDGGTL